MLSGPIEMAYCYFHTAANVAHPSVAYPFMLVNYFLDFSQSSTNHNFTQDVFEQIEHPMHEIMLG